LVHKLGSGLAMLRASANGVQRVEPKAKAAPVAARPAPTLAKAPAAARTFGVLSYKSIAKPEELGDDENMSLADQEPQEPLPSTGPRRMIMNPLAPTSKAPPTPALGGAMPPRAKAKANTAPEKRPAPKEELQEEEGILDNETWAKQFEQKWAAAMGDTRAESGPAAKKPKLLPTQPSGPPPSSLLATPNTPAEALSKEPVSKGDVGAILEEHPDWATRCTIDPARPGQPQRLSVSMPEMGLGDSGLSKWCAWMDRRLTAERPDRSGEGSAARNRFRATNVDFSENELGVVGVKALFLMLEKHGIRCEVLRLTGNMITNEGVRWISKYLTCSSQPMASELILTRNRITGEGMKWLLGNLVMHPAYPIWINDTKRFLPLWIKAENVKLKGKAGYQVFSSACSTLSCSVCLCEDNGAVQCGPRQCVNVGCCDELKHNCVAHISFVEATEDSEPLPAPSPHARLIFAAPGRGKPKALPSGIESAVREEPRLLYEDDDLAVVLKPAGWSCMPQPKGVDPAWAKLKPLARRQQVGELLGQPAAAPLQAWLLLHFGADPNNDAARDQASDRGIAHRLDVDASGPLLVGKTLRGYEHARKQIAAGLVKDYLALVHGSLEVERGECHAAIDASKYAETKRVCIGPSGQPATTVWEVIAEYEEPESGERFTLLNCRMVTLRTHQLRVHLQHLGHPLVGDKLYGDGGIPSFCPRLFLHKMRIGFFNMEGHAAFEASSLQCAPDLWRALGRLRKVGGMAMMGCGAPGL